MLREYEESDSIMDITRQTLQMIRTNIDQAQTPEEALSTVRVLQDILKHRHRFFDHISHGGTRTGFEWRSEELFHISGDALATGSRSNLNKLKEDTSKHLDDLINDISFRAPSLSHRFGIPTWSYHHPREDAPQYLYSYAHADYISEKIIDFLKGMIPYQVKFWVDKDEIRRHMKIPEELSKAIDSSQAAILMLSQNYLKSKWCSQEWQSAIERNITHQALRLYVVQIDACQIPSLLTPYFNTNLTGLPSPGPFLELLKLIEDIIRYESLRS